MAQFAMIARQMGCNRNGISHKEAHNSSVEAENYADVHLEESDRQAASSHTDVVNIENLSLSYRILKLIK